jgi:hypothetical protein
MQDFERLGVFYLGKAYDLEQDKLLDDLVLYKSKDLTTHAVIIGMTGSGKTGLGIGILEEAAIDRIPVIAIDPKGDLGNMALAFPDLRPEDFRPWINLHEAANKGYTPDDYAAAQAELWKKGLEDWGQSGKRIEKLLDAVDITVYTPGSSAGPGVSVLRSFDAPPARLQEDRDAYRDRIHATATGLLGLLGIDVDPLTSREHILISGILEHYWQLGQNLGLPELIMAIQTPPMEKVGVMDLESFYPAKDRFALAMKLNGLLASPGFKAWLEGEPLDINSFLYTKNGKPRVSIFSIAHLSDSERMFFVTMLLNEVLAWVRTQPGTGSLRALLYMDELFGYLPPTANPPSKTPLLTLLKQARAYGLGLILATQNPVDLDYKALSNAGTWFIGRLQTERDKARVLAGLEGAAAGGMFDRRRTEQILAGLGKRMFYLHSVHEDEALILQTRWVLSYLAGPLTRDQIAALPSKRPVAPFRETDHIPPADMRTRTAGVDVPESQFRDAGTVPPVLPPSIRQVYLPPTGRVTGDLVYVPSVIGVADVQYTGTKHGVAASQRHVFLTPLHEGPVALDWKESEPLDLDLGDLEASPLEGAVFADYPKSAADPKSYERWKRLFSQFLRAEVPLQLFFSPTLKIVSEPGEDERDFRIRLQHLGHERRDEAIETLRKKYASKMVTLEDRRRRARQALERQTSQAQQKKLDAAISTGTALLGVLLGRKSISATSISRVGTAVRSAGRAHQSGSGISQAEETLRSVEAQLRELESQLQQQLERVAEIYNPLDEKLEEVNIRATSSNITVHLVGLAWCPST